MSRASKQATLREQADLQAEAKARAAAGSAAPPPAADGGDLEPEAPPAAVIDPTEDAPLDAAAEETPQPAAATVEDPRDAIYGRAREVRDKEIAEHAADPEVQQLDRFSGGQPAATNAQPVAAEGDETTTPPSGEDDTGPRRKVVIYGKEVEVPEDRVIAAGVEHLQKTGAAEYRLQQAAEAEKRLRKYHQELDAYRDTLATQAKTPGASATPSAALPNKGARPATTVADAAKLDTLAEKVAASIFRGDMDATKAALREAFSDVAQGRGDATPPSLDVDTVVEAAVAKVREIGKQERAAESETSKRERVNGTFQREFATVWDHPEAFAVAHTRFQALVADPDNAGKPLEDLAREAGTAALSRYPELRAEQHREDPAPRPRAQTPVPDELANRRVVKRTIVRQPAASARKPAAPEAPAVLSNKDYVAQMRANRGLPST